MKLTPTYVLISIPGRDTTEYKVNFQLAGHFAGALADTMDKEIIQRQLVAITRHYMSTKYYVLCIIVKLEIRGLKPEDISQIRVQNMLNYTFFVIVVQAANYWPTEIKDDGVYVSNNVS